MTRRGWLKQAVAMGALLLLGVQKITQRSLRAEKRQTYPGRVNKRIKITGPSPWGG